ncbi:MAG: hypothetical protein JSR77_08260 [Planctomycetes bacterium]|nr:hypothetical protein [Planctomycetota bacterium]
MSTLNDRRLRLSATLAACAGLAVSSFAYQEAAPPPPKATEPALPQTPANPTKIEQPAAPKNEPAPAAPAKASVPEAQPPGAPATPIPAQPATPPATSPPAQPQGQPAGQAPAQPAPTPPAQPAPAAPAQPAPEQKPAPAQPAAAAQPTLAAAPVKPTGISFNFKDAPVDQVLDFFAREAGVPIIFEAPAPQGTITFVSSSAYPFEDALSILNLNLQRFAVHLRKQDQYLYLATLQDSMKKPAPVTDVANLDKATPDQIVTVSIPLDNARAETVTEQIKAMVGPFGGVIAVPAQNMVVVVETAAQVRRIREIVRAIDNVRPVDSAFRLFPLKYAQADAVLGALRGLVGERVTTVIVDKDGQKRTLQEQQVTGVQLAADPRTNSIVAVGSGSRIKTVEDLVMLLDTPDGAGGEIQMQTFVLSSMTPEAAVPKINALFSSLEPKKRPTIIPIAEGSKVSIVGPTSLLAQAASFLSQLDPGSGPAGSPAATRERRAMTIKLKYATPQQVEAVVSRLLSPRQNSVVKFAVTPDGKGLVVAGPDADVDNFEQLVTAMDVPADADREVRLARITGAEPDKILAKVQELYQKTGKAERQPVQAMLDKDSRTVTLIGPKVALNEFVQLMTSTQSAANVDLEVRRFTLKQSRPSVLAAKLSRLAAPLLTPADGSQFVEPQFDAADEVKTLVVRALPGQFAVLSGLVEQLDGQESGANDVRVVRLATGDSAALLARAQKLYTERTTGMSQDQAGPVKTDLDAASGCVVISGNAAGVRLFADTLTQAQQLVPPTRTTRVIDVHNVPAVKVLEGLTELLHAAEPVDPARKVPDPTIQVIERSNSLLITAEEPQHRVIADFLTRLDRLETTSLPPLKLLQLRTAESVAIAAMLTEQYGKRSQTERSAKPVEVRADAGTNTLIVSAHPDLFEEIKNFVEEINKDKTAAKRITEIFPLKVAKASDVASAMERLYPEPPIPTDRTGRPQPWLKQPREVQVSAEPNSNALIIDAPAERMESLRELAGKLDRVELPPAAQLQTYRVHGASLDAVARTLRAMSDRGIMAEPAQPGKQPVQVLIETEPKSGTLIVAGDQRTFETVEKVLADLSLVPVEKGLRIIPIANQKAAAVRTRALAIYDAQVSQIPGANPIDVTVDEASNSLMVVADKESMDRFAKVMDELQRQTGPAREVRLLELKVAKAEEVVGFLRDLVKSSEALMIRGGAEPSFEVIEATNTIMAAAQPSQFPIIDALVKSLDNRQMAEKPPMRIMRLRSTDAANLAAVLQREYDKRPAEQRGKQPVTIEADPGTNTLIVSAQADVLPEIEAIVARLNEMDAAGAEGREIRIFPLKVARAEELGQTIDQMFPEPPVPLDPRTRQPRPDLKPAREVVVRADRATNSLIVDAPAKRLAGFEQIVKSLDQAKVADDLTLRTYRMKRADASAVAATLRSLATSGSLGNAGKSAAAPVTVSVDAPTRTLIVSGPTEIFAAVEDVVNKVDAAPEMPASDLKLYPLAKARADRLAPVVQRLLAARARELVTSQGKGGAEDEKLVEVTADAASNTLIVSAPREIIAIADGVIKSLDADSIATATEVRVFRLGKGSAETSAKAVAAAIKAQASPGEPDATVTPEPASNTIVVVGTTAQLERAAKLIESLDVAVDKEGMGVKSITLKHARAESLAPVLEQVLARESALDKLPEWAKMQAIARGAEEKPKVHVAAEPRMNAIVISGPRAVLDVAEQVVAELDIEGGASPDGGRPVRVISLRNADATELAANLSAVFADEKGKEAPPTVRVDAQSNSLIIRGSQAQMATVDELVKKLDNATVNSSRQLRMIPVDKSRVDAELLARTLKRLIEQQGGAKVEVISTDELLKRQGKDVPKKSSLLWNLDGPVPVKAAVFAAAMAIATEPEVVGPPSSNDNPDDTDATIAIDSATNSIILVGPPRLTDRLAELAAELQKQMPAEPVAVHVVTLASTTDAQPIAQLVNQTLTQIGRHSINNPGGFSGPVSVTADPAGAALIVLANDADFSTVASLITSIAQLDNAAEVTVKMYPLANITAQRAVQSVRDLFSTEPRGQQARRVRAVDVTLAGPAGPVAGRIDPASVKLTADATGASLIVSAPASAIPLIDRLIETLDQSPVKDRLAIRRYQMTHASADELARTFAQLLDAQRQGPATTELPTARFVADARTNSLFVTASAAQHEEVTRLLAAADATTEAPNAELAIITLQQATPSVVQRIVEEVVVGKDPAKKSRVFLSSQDGSNIFVVRAAPDIVTQVKAIVAQVDAAETGGLPVRSVKLEKADASAVATALQKFFTDRAAVSARPGQKVVNRVAVVGDKRTGTLVVSSSDEDFAQVQSLVKTFDSPSPSQDFQLKIIPLKNARVGDLGETIKNMIDEVRWTSTVTNRQQQGDEHQLFVEVNDASNSIVLMGRGEQIAVVEKVLAALDQEPIQRAAMAIKSVEVKNADLAAIRTVLERAFSTPGWRPWRGADPAAVTVQIDKLRRAVILVGKTEQVEKAMAYVKELDAGPTGKERLIEAVALTHARADRAAQNLRQFFMDRAKGQGIEGPGVSVIGSPDGNVLIVSAEEGDMKVLHDLVAQIDQPDAGKDRRIEVFVLQNGAAKDTAEVLRSMFAKNGDGQERVNVTPQPSTNSVIVSAPSTTFDEVAALLKQLDAPPKAEEANIETVALTTARAQDVAQAVKAALPPNVKVVVTPVVRSNSLMLTGSKEAIALVMDQVKKIDKEPLRSGQVFRRYTLAAADAQDVAGTIQDVVRARPRNATEPEASIDYSRPDNTITVYASADQIDEIEKIIKELDLPAAQDRATEFVKLEFANAEQTANALKVFYGRFAPEAVTPAARNVTILPDPLSNSLVIRADKGQWEGIRALLSKLDTKEYDTKRQLAVIALTHADAVSIAKALNEGFRAPLEEQLRQAQARAVAQRAPGNRNQQFPEATVLVDAEGVPTVSAEPQTNSLVVFAGSRDLSRIEEIVKQLDVSGFANMPAARIIALKSGKPTAVATTIRELYLNKLDRAQQTTIGPRSVLVIGDDASGALIVRADDEKFAQIKALAETLEQQGQIGRVMPHVVRLKTIAAGRIRPTILNTFTETAKQQGETLAVEVDRAGNALIIACSDRLLTEIKKVIDELDTLPPGTDKTGPVAGLNQSVFVIDINNNSPADIKKMLEDMGLTKPQAVDRPGVVAEPITIVTLSSRRALAVVASAADGAAVESLVKALDVAPVDANQIVAVIPLRMASAKPVVDTLTSMLKPSDQSVDTGPAKALAEHVRRLGISKAGVDQSGAQVDLSKPIRLIADVEANSVIVASTQANVDAMREMVRLIDTLPVGDAVIVRIFTLSNASAQRVKQVVDQLFTQGEALRRLPGTKRQGLPPTATGQALAGDIAVAIDERTNTLVVAGREEGVALVEVLIKDLDSDRAASWIEPTILPLKHADASQLAKKLQEVLVRGLTLTPEAVGLQKQYGRLRMTLDGKAVDPADKGAAIQADLFAPVTGLVISAEEQLNALIVVGTPANLQVVKALVGQLDVEAASAANTVRLFPLQYAASERVSSVLRDMFRQRETLPDQRPEDRLIISSDVRTNSLIVSTSPKSFAMLEGVLKTLDGEKANFSVGMHVVPVQNADVKLLAPRIDRLMKERLSAAAQSGSVRNPLDAFSIEPEPVSNLLIVACSDENLQVVKELVTALTADAAKMAAGERVDVVQLTKARAAEIAQSLTSLYADKENQRRGQGAVAITPNERLNALVLSGNEQDMIELRSLAKKLDSAEVAMKQQIKWIELRSANATEVVTLIQSVIAGRPVGGGRGVGARQATKLQFLRDTVAGDIAAAQGRKPSEAEVDGAIRDQVTLTPDARTNSIWITAPEPMVKLVMEMIEDIEKSSAGARRIERFTLVNADARQMAELLKDTFKLEQRGNAMVLLPTGQRRGADGANATDEPDSAPTVTAVPDERQQLSIAVDARTNTLIVSGTEEYLELVRKVVSELDGITANERERRVYSLRNAKAKEIETTLKSYFKSDSDTERTTLGPQLSGSLMRRLEQEVTVVGDEKSNKLVISTSPRYMQTVISIVNELDTPPPQVMIQVLLAEVTLDSSEQWGMDVSVGPFGGDAYKVGFLGAGTGVATALGVPNLSVSSADFSILIRSLEAQGKLEVLSNPQVTVNNNQKAEINVGDEIGVAGNTERSSVGSLISSVQRIPVGIIMNVTPSISDDGFVRMDINPEISQLTNRTTQINRDQTAPIITRRKVDTVVTVKDGQSVVIGGLIQTTMENRRTKVPFLGDIPVLGVPFRSKLEESKKTELLVIVTPRVIPNLPGSVHGDIEDVTDQTVNRLEDPSRVLDYLERIKADVKARREKAMQRPPEEPVPDPAATIPSPEPLRPDYGPPLQAPAPARSPEQPAPSDGPQVVPPPKEPEP